MRDASLDPQTHRPTSSPSVTGVAVVEDRHPHVEQSEDALLQRMVRCDEPLPGQERQALHLRDPFQLRACLSLHRGYLTQVVLRVREVLLQLGDDLAQRLRVGAGLQPGGARVDQRLLPSLHLDLRAQQGVPLALDHLVQQPEVLHRLVHESLRVEQQFQHGRPHGLLDLLGAHGWLGAAVVVRQVTGEVAAVADDGPVGPADARRLPSCSRVASGRVTASGG